jgi:hypothetical protein
VPFNLSQVGELSDRGRFALEEDNTVRTQIPVCLGVTAVASALFVATDRNRSATAQEAAVQNQADQQLDPPRRTSQRETQVQNRTGRLTLDQSARSLPKFRASALIGMNVRGVTGEDEIGEIKDIAIGQDGTVAYVAVSFGGFLGLGDKLFAVPFEAVEFVREDPNDPDDEDYFARIEVTEDQLRARKGFNEENWPEEADESFRQSSPRRTRQVERPAPRGTDATR